jgi:hypothetical protein
MLERRRKPDRPPAMQPGRELTMARWVLPSPQSARRSRAPHRPHMLDGLDRAFVRDAELAPGAWSAAATRPEKYFPGPETAASPLNVSTRPDVHPAMPPYKPEMQDADNRISWSRSVCCGFLACFRSWSRHKQCGVCFTVRSFGARVHGLDRAGSCLEPSRGADDNIEAEARWHGLLHVPQLRARSRRIRHLDRRLSAATRSLRRP